MSTHTPKLFVSKAPRYNGDRWDCPVSFKDTNDITSDYLSVFGDSKEESEANAARIVEAWNNFDDMKEAIKWLLEVYPPHQALHEGRMERWEEINNLSNNLSS